MFVLSNRLHPLILSGGLQGFPLCDDDDYDGDDFDDVGDGGEWC